VRQLKAAGCKTVYREMASGARAQLRQLLDQLEAGDVAAVTRSPGTLVARICTPGAPFRTATAKAAAASTTCSQLSNTGSVCCAD
jgi:antitoxin (DNA-binding transcriptional repressor) of toxin-antitoxin stability system